MNFVHFKNSLRDFPVFSIADIRAAHGGFDRRRLSEWQKKGYIKKIIKGYYLFSDVDINENTLLAIANKIYKPSYISFETAMSYYRLIPESIYMITSASTRRTSLFETTYGTVFIQNHKTGIVFWIFAAARRHKNGFHGKGDPGLFLYKPCSSNRG